MHWGPAGRVWRGVRAGARHARGRLADARAASREQAAEAALIRASGLFDASFYAGQAPESAAPGRDAATHFVTRGWREGRLPHPLFDTTYYLETQPDVAQAGVNPLAHFLTGGWKEGRNPHPLFDVAYYLAAYPDVERAGVNPLAHFAHAGWRDGRHPHPAFDTGYYLRSNPDVAAQGMNPLSHFTTSGMREGRRPSPLFDDALELPLPGWAWERGESRVERVLRTFFYRRAAPLGVADVRRLAGEIAAAAAAQPRLVAAHGTEPRASVIVPVFNQLKLTLWCLHAVLTQAYRCAFELVVVDDGSTDETPRVLPEIRGLRYLRTEANRGFVHACNQGAREARGELLVFLNNDTLPLAGWLDALADTFGGRPEAGAVGARLIYPDGRLQEAGGIVWQEGAAWNYGRDRDRNDPEMTYVRSVDFCSGAALAVPAALFREAGAFDTALAPAYGEDLDLALRLRDRGHAVLYQPRAQVVHLEGATAGTSTRRGVKASQVRNLELLARRWQLALRGHRPEGDDPRREKDRDAERRVLFLDAFTPRPDQDAGSLDVLHWLRALAGLGFQVTFVPCMDFRSGGRYTEALQALGIECVHAPFGSPQEFVQRHGAEFDLCVCYRNEVADAMMTVLKASAPQAKLLLALCDLAHIRLQRKAALTGSPKDRRAAGEAKYRELLACAQSDALWTPSAWEKETLEQELPQAEVFVWPLSQDLHPPRNGYAQRARIGFIGGYRHAPNVDAAQFLVREVLPLVLEAEPGIVLDLAGSHMPPEVSGLTHPAVRVLGHVDDLQAFFEGLRVFVAPVRFGAGVKGKVAASLAAGVPVVGTSLALEGMGLAREEGAVAADDPRALAREIVRVYRDPALWSRLSRAGYERAERDYSFAARTRHVAAAAARLHVVTRRVEECLGTAPERPAPFDLPGLEVDVCRGKAEYLALRQGARLRERAAFEDGLIRDAGGDEVVYRAYSFPAGRPVVYRAAVTLGPGGNRRVGWREELACPFTGLNNRQRATAAFAQRILEDREHVANDVYLTEQVTPLFKWMTHRFRTVRIMGSEYLGPQARGGEVRDGIRHEDLERLSLPDASQDLVLSCDVLEHVNEPRAALGELARVLRPGGHLLFTVPFVWDWDENRRRARVAGGGVEHLVDPCYHGNPLDPNGSLAFFDYGWELLDWVRAAGFGDVSVVCYWSAALGHLGGMLEIFHAVR